MTVVADGSGSGCVSSERAKLFWAGQDVDQAFEQMLEHLDGLRSALKGNTATDRGQPFTLEGAALLLGFVLFLPLTVSCLDQSWCRR